MSPRSGQRSAAAPSFDYAPLRSGHSERRLSVEIVIQTIPLLAPMPTAFVVGQAMVRVMHWPLAMAIVGALIIEGLGFGAVDTAMRMYDYNKGKRKTDPAAPAWIAYSVAGIYAAVALTLTIFLDIFPLLAQYAPGVFPFLGMLGALLWALRKDHERRVNLISEEKVMKRQERKERREAEGGRREARLQGKKGQDAPSGGRKSVPVEELLAFWRANPKASDGEVARQFGIFRQAVQQRRVKLIGEGKIRMNGSGVEVVDAAVSGGRPVAASATHVAEVGDSGLGPLRPMRAPGQGRKKGVSSGGGGGK